MKLIFLISIFLLALTFNTQSQTQPPTNGSYQPKRDAGRKAIKDTSTNEIVDGKYKPYVKPINKIKLDTTTEKTQVIVQQQSREELKQVESVVLIDVQKRLKQLTYNQNQAGKLLIDAKKARIEGLIWMASCSALSTIVFVASDGNRGANGFAVGVFALGGTMSIVKVVQAFNKIEAAGKVLLE